MERIDYLSGNDPQVYRIMDMLFYNRCIKAALQSSHNLKPDYTVLKLMKTFQDFRNALKEKIYISGDKQIQIDKKLRTAYKTTILQTAAIKGMCFPIRSEQEDILYK